LYIHSSLDSYVSSLNEQESFLLRKAGFLGVRPLSRFFWLLFLPTQKK